MQCKDPFMPFIWHRQKSASVSFSFSYHINGCVWFTPFKWFYHKIYDSFKSKHLFTQIFFTHVCIVLVIWTDLQNLANDILRRNARLLCSMSLLQRCHVACHVEIPRSVNLPERIHLFHKMAGETIHWHAHCEQTHSSASLKFKLCNHTLPWTIGMCWVHTQLNEMWIIWHVLKIAKIKLFSIRRVLLCITSQFLVYNRYFYMHLNNGLNSPSEWHRFQGK